DHGIRGPDRVVGRGGVLGHDKVNAPTAQDLDLRAPRRRAGDRVEDDHPGSGGAGGALRHGSAAGAGSAASDTLADWRPARPPSTSSAAWSMRATSSSE